MPDETKLKHPAPLHCPHCGAYDWALRLFDEGLIQMLCRTCKTLFDMVYHEE